LPNLTDYRKNDIQHRFLENLLDITFTDGVRRATTLHRKRLRCVAGFASELQCLGVLCFRLLLAAVRRFSLRGAIVSKRVSIRGFLSVAAFGILTAVIVIVALAFQPSALAQQTSAALGGTVLDAFGAVVADAKVTLKNEASGDLRSIVSNAEGYFT